MDGVGGGVDNAASCVGAPAAGNDGEVVGAGGGGGGADCGMSE